MSDSLVITFVSHRLDRRGGQEKSSHEVLSRLKLKGHQINIVSFGLEDWDCENSEWHRVPGQWIKIQLLKNLWFSLYTYFYLLFKKPQLTMTIGVSSWKADVRLVQFVHMRYLNNAKKKLAPLPNERTFIHRLYQLLFAHWTVFLEKRLFKNTHYFIAISDQIKEEIREIIGNESHSVINVIHHAPDKTSFTQKSVPMAGALELLFVGALERKGVHKVIDILKILENESWCMNIVGDGDLIRWKKYIKDLSLEEKVIIHGAKPSIPFFEKAHIFVFPSTYEPFGLVVSEAISYNALPMASSECGAMELWKDRPDRLKLSARDETNKWADTLRLYLQDRKKLQEDIDQASFHILKRSWDDAAFEYEKFLSQIDNHTNKEIYT